MSSAPLLVWYSGSQWGHFYPPGWVDQASGYSDHHDSEWDASGIQWVEKEQPLTTGNYPTQMLTAARVDKPCVISRERLTLREHS